MLLGLHVESRAKEIDIFDVRLKCFCSRIGRERPIWHDSHNHEPRRAAMESFEVLRIYALSRMLWVMINSAGSPAWLIGLVQIVGILEYML